MARLALKIFLCIGFCINPVFAQNVGHSLAPSAQKGYEVQDSAPFLSHKATDHSLRRVIGRVLRKSSIFITTAVVGLSIAFQTSVKPAQAGQDPLLLNQPTYEFVQPKLGTNTYAIEDINQNYFREMATSLEFKLGRKAYQFVKEDGTTLRMSTTKKDYVLQELDRDKDVVLTSRFSSTTELLSYAKGVFPLPPLADRVAPVYGFARFYGPRAFIGAVFVSAMASRLKPKSSANELEEDKKSD